MLRWDCFIYFGKNTPNQKSGSGFRKSVSKGQKQQKKIKNKKFKKMQLQATSMCQVQSIVLIYSHSFR